MRHFCLLLLLPTEDGCHDKLIVSMYKDGEPLGDILVASGFSNPASIFRILKKHGVELNRSKGRGPHGPSKKKDADSGVPDEE